MKVPAFFNLPSVKERKEQIETIIKTDIKKTTIEDLCEKLVPIIHGHYYPLLMFISGTSFFRGIIYKDKPKFFKDVIYPPADKAKMNRANTEGQSMFYCSTLKKTSLYEIDAKPGDKVILTSWVLKIPTAVPSIGYSVSQLNELCELYSISNPKSNLHESDVSELMEITSQFFRENFCKKIDVSNDSLKKLTIAISKTYLASSSIDQEGKFVQNNLGLFYPTTRMTTESDNFVFFPKVIDSHIITFEMAEWIEIIEISGNTFEYSILDVALTLDPDDALIWEELKNRYTVDKNCPQIYFSDPFGDMQAFTSDGIAFAPDV